MLLLLTEEDLVTVFAMSNKFHRRKFMQDLTELRIRADYSSEGLGLGEKQYFY